MPRGSSTTTCFTSARPELALLTGISGWEADAALTWFAAFASLMLMMGLAAWFGGRATGGALGAAAGGGGVAAAAAGHAGPSEIAVTR